jgi:chromosome segregation protein
LPIAHETLDGEERRAKSRAAELEHRIAQTVSDIARETALIEDAAGVLARLEQEANALASTGAAEAEIDAARGRLADAEAALAIRRRRSPRRRTQGPRWARRAALEAAIQEETARAARLEAEVEKVKGERGAHISDSQGGVNFGLLEAALDETIAAATAAKTNWPSPKPAVPRPVPKNEKPGLRWPKPSARRKISKRKSRHYRNC